MHPDGSHLVNLTRSAFDDRYPAWSPDGNWLAFRVHRGIEHYISKICVTCQGELKEVRVTDEATSGGCPKWSPDGWKIAYMNVYDQGLWVINADGSGATSLFIGHLFDFIWRR